MKIDEVNVDAIKKNMKSSVKLSKSSVKMSKDDDKNGKIGKKSKRNEVNIDDGEGSLMKSEWANEGNAQAQLNENDGRKTSSNADAARQFNWNDLEDQDQEWFMRTVPQEIELFRNTATPEEIDQWNEHVKECEREGWNEVQAWATDGVNNGWYDEAPLGLFSQEEWSTGCGQGGEANDEQWPEENCQEDGGAAAREEFNDGKWPGGDGQEEWGATAHKEFNKEEEQWTNGAGGEFNHEEWPENEPQKEDFGGQDHQDDSNDEAKPGAENPGDQGPEFNDGEQGEGFQGDYDNQNEERSCSQDVQAVDLGDEDLHSSSVEDFIGECEGPESDFYDEDDEWED